MTKLWRSRSAITGTGYILVEPNPKDPKFPRIHIEHPDQVIVEHVPGTNRRDTAAALKVWVDEWTEKTFATLYLPDAIYKFQTGSTFTVSFPPCGIASRALMARLSSANSSSAPSPLR